MATPGADVCSQHNARTVVIDYYETLEDRRVVSTVEPGYLRQLLPDAIPQNGEPWADIQRDITEKIIPGLTHWFAPSHPSPSSPDRLTGFTGNRQTS